ncbi:hypothetical protein CRM22_011232, partial [Opisthorchis felineus]
MTYEGPNAAASHHLANLRDDINSPTGEFYKKKSTDPTFRLSLGGGCRRHLFCSSYGSLHITGW